MSTVVHGVCVVILTHGIFVKKLMNNNEQRVPTALKPLSEDPKFQKVLVTCRFAVLLTTGGAQINCTSGSTIDRVRPPIKMGGNR